MTTAYSYALEDLLIEKIGEVADAQEGNALIRRFEAFHDDLRLETVEDRVREKHGVVWEDDILAIARVGHVHFVLGTDWPEPIVDTVGEALEANASL